MLTKVQGIYEMVETNFVCEYVEAGSLECVGCLLSRFTERIAPGLQYKYLVPTSFQYESTIHN